jgi:hypothetical protein
MFILALLTAFAAAALSYPALSLGRAGRLGVLLVVWSAILATPLWISADRPFLRALAGIWAITLSVKLYDLHRGAILGHHPGGWTFLAFLPNPSSVVLRKLDAEPRPGRREDGHRLARGLLGFALGMVLIIVTFRFDWRPFPFAVEHGTKAIAYFLVLLPAASAGASALRLLGVRVREPMDNPFASRTPADFWKRYEDVFKPLGGLRAPIRGTFGTFAVSAIIHESLFTIAIGRVQGYQTAFFMLQGIAVAATLRARPKGWRQVPWQAATFAFNLASSALFFASVNEVLPFYAPRGSPGP